MKDSKNTYKTILDFRGQKFSKITQGMHDKAKCLPLPLFLFGWTMLDKKRKNIYLKSAPFQESCI